MQTPSITSHSGFLARSSSFSGCFKSSIFTDFASAISSGVLRLIKTGFPLHNTVIVFPGSTALTSTSVLANALTDASVKALASTEVDISQIEPGKSITVLWRGKPVFIRRRTQDEIAEARSVKLEDLKHPEKDEDRATNPEWLVMLGVCTHLGCVPLDQKGEYNGWFCPCHGSHYDISGRIRKGPAPTNMEIPKYEFVNANTIKIG